MILLPSMFGKLSFFHCVGVLATRELTFDELVNFHLNIQSVDILHFF